MLPLLRTAVCSLAAGAHRLAGRVWFKIGNSDRSRLHFERVLELKGDDFVAYVYLGRLAYGLGDYAGWRREYEHARRTSPDRYARLKNPFDLFEPRSAGTLREETGERATWRTVRLHRTQAAQGGASGGLPAPGESLRSPPHFDRECPTGSPLRRYGDDFASDDERARFRTLEPIEADEVRTTDLERLIDELTQGRE